MNLSFSFVCNNVIFTLMSFVFTHVSANLRISNFSELLYLILIMYLGVPLNKFFINFMGTSYLLLDHYCFHYSL
jgi:hypothetical protein